MKIDSRDFYAAFHTLGRADKLDVEKTYLEKFKLFTEVSFVFYHRQLYS